MFGHTHSYTRGNDKNTPHVALNVATSVGRLDHFAEFAQYDYDTVALSNDENGYNIFTMTAEGDKQITMTRRNGGSSIVASNTTSLCMKLRFIAFTMVQANL